MSLCCCQTLTRTASYDAEMEELLGRPARRFSGLADRNWSGRLVPRPSENKRNGHRRSSSMAAAGVEERAVEAADGEPRLLRSGGMRRDWSFEDLKNARLMQRE